MLQYLDFSNVDVAGQIEALRQRSLLTDQQAAAVETAPLERFLRSPLAEEIRKSRSVLREPHRWQRGATIGSWSETVKKNLYRLICLVTQ